MPRRRRAFSDLERLASQAGFQADPNSRVGKYLAWKSQPNIKKQKNKTPNAAETAARRDGKAISLIPFNKPVATTPIRYVSRITAFSATERANYALSDAELGYFATTGAQRGGGYYPALIRPFRPTGAAITPRSGITGVEYKTRPGNSATIPFGRRSGSLDADTEETRRQALANECKKQTLQDGKRATTVGYEPEVWRYEAPSDEDLTGLPTFGATTT